MATNETKNRADIAKKSLEFKVDATTLTVLAVAALLLPLLIVGFWG